MPLAQVDASDQKISDAGKKHPLVNVDKNGVILKGYDPVAYFKQSRAVKGGRGIRVDMKAPLTTSRREKIRPNSTRLLPNMRRNTAVSVPTR